MNLPGWRQWGWMFVAALSTALVVLALTTLVLIRQTQLDGQARSKQTNAVAQRVESCTTPGRECFKRGQDATAAAVASINQVAVYAAVCADRPGTTTVPRIQRCIEELLEEYEQ